MTNRHTPTIIIVVAVTWLTAATNPSAQMFAPTGRETLRGLPGVELQTEPFETDIERDGLSRAAIQTEIAQRLQAGGITVYPSQRANPSDAKAYLYLLINSVQIAGEGQYAINVQVHLRQTMRSLVTPTNVVNAMTWDQTDVIVVRKSELPKVREVIREFVDQFIRDWKAVH